MTWLSSKLSKRVQILIPSLEPRDDGGSALVFGKPMGDDFAGDEFGRLAPVLTIWMGMTPVTFKGSGSKYIRGEQVNEVIEEEIDIDEETSDEKSSRGFFGFFRAMGFSVSEQGSFVPTKIFYYWGAGFLFLIVLFFVSIPIRRKLKNSKS